VAHVDFYVKNTMWTGGEAFWLHSFFSTIAYKLERDGWGSRFPALMNELSNRATPWPVPPGASSLADSFLTASGKDMLDLLARALGVAEEAHGDVEIRALEQTGTHIYFVTGER
jgi:hypothetical protein